MNKVAKSEVGKISFPYTRLIARIWLHHADGDQGVFNELAESTLEHLGMKGFLAVVAVFRRMQGASWSGNVGVDGQVVAGVRETQDALMSLQVVH